MDVQSPAFDNIIDPWSYGRDKKGIFVQPLPTEFTQKGFTYTQEERHGMRAIYRQMRPHWKSPRYEVIVIRIAKEHTWPDGNTTPEHEAYPSSSSWGSLGTSHYTLVEAQERLARVASAQEGR